MKKILLFITILFSLIVSSQDFEYKEYSYSQFVELMQKENDSVFKLENAIVKYDSITDKEFLVADYYSSRKTQKNKKEPNIIVDKVVELENVQFLLYEDFDSREISSIHRIIFEKNVSIQNSFGFNLSNCVFKKDFEFVNFEYDKYTAVKKKYPAILNRAYVYKSEFLGKVRVINSAASIASTVDLAFYFGYNHFRESSYRIFIANWSMEYIDFSYNIFDTPTSYYVHLEEMINSSIENNSFNKGIPQFYCIEHNQLTFKDNAFNVPSLINFKAINNVNFIGANQFKSTIGSLDGYRDYVQKLDEKNTAMSYWEISDREDTFFNYITKERIENLTYYQFELDQLSVFYNNFRDKHNSVEANKFYIEIKDLESRRLAYEHNLNPTFSAFFKIQINKFLKLFSNYGTEPERAVVVSLYVILLFALIYLFFPNHWDSHGKNRLMDRFRFFTKYMNKDAGMHDVYLEEQQDELLASEDFKNYMQQSEKHIPKFFMATAMPLYKWSVSGIKISTSLLKRVDIMKGTWQELPKSKRIWKSILLVGAFLIAIVYDIFIKILNALMLSINTFTTLGFGEIPIKGLPRYLAIIQGFIGWFMLTIFSVSLISQLLN